MKAYLIPLFIRILDRHQLVRHVSDEGRNMKCCNYLISLLFMSIVIVFHPSQTLAAEESISLVPAPETFAQACADFSQRGIRISWKGISDRRPHSEIGYQHTAKEAKAVHTHPALNEIFDKNLRLLLQSCGILLTTPSETPSLELSTEILQFNVDVEKRLITSKQKGMGSLSLTLTRGGASRTVEVGVNTSGKDIRRKGLTLFAATAHDLLEQLLQAIPAQIAPSIAYLNGATPTR